MGGEGIVSFARWLFWLQSGHLVGFGEEEKEEGGRGACSSNVQHSTTSRTSITIPPTPQSTHANKHTSLCIFVRVRLRLRPKVDYATFLDILHRPSGFEPAGTAG